MKVLNYIGARLGNWNDRVNGGDTRTTRRRPRLWLALDHLAAWLHTRGEGQWTGWPR